MLIEPPYNVEGSIFPTLAVAYDVRGVAPDLIKDVPPWINVPEIISQDMQAVVLGPNPYQRAGICSTLERAAIGVLCETADHHAVARLATLQEVDVIVLNNPLPGQGAADALRAMPTRRPIKLVALPRDQREDPVTG